jgi:large subunit ribosomal protein L25
VRSGGVLEQQLHGLDVSCLPKDLPETLQADVSEMEIGDSLQVKDLNLPDGVSAGLGEDVVIAIVAMTRVAKSEGVDGEEEGEEGATEEAAAAE